MDREQTYIIYKVTSPSGKCYVGLTKVALKTRWQQHVQRSRSTLNHPFYNAIRKYSAASFAVEHIASALGSVNAQATEVLCISQIEKAQRYNLSAGGENDGVAASRIFWQRMKSNPEALAAYRKKLVEAQGAREPASAEEIATRSLAAAKWRTDNPRDAWKNSYRASRVALRKTKGVKEAKRKERAERPLKEKLLAKHKNRRLSSTRAVMKIWAERDANEKLTIGGKIAETLKEKYKTDVKFKALNTSQVATARKKIDRVHQAARASAGLKNYWVELRKDKVKYAEYIEQRKATLKETTNRKKDASKNL